jgi:hypothetical protein
VAEVRLAVPHVFIPFLLVPLAALSSGVPFGRFLIRVLPPRFSGARRTVAFWIVGALAILVIIWDLRFVMAALTLGSSDLLPAIIALALFCVPPAAWLLGATGPLVLRHRHPRAFLDRPYVLFLRRFSTFSDRSILGLVLRQAPAGKPIVFLTSARSQPGDWNPFLVGFAGMKLWHPFRSVPIMLRANDADWQQVAEELIARASTILIDTSEGSGSITTEVELIGQRL